MNVMIRIVGRPADVDAITARLAEALKPAVVRDTQRLPTWNGEVRLYLTVEEPDDHPGE